MALRDLIKDQPGAASLIASHDDFLAATRRIKKTEAMAVKAAKKKKEREIDLAYAQFRKRGRGQSHPDP